ncbi:ABC transporter ATP-binding protein [Arthrobacter sp. ISL-30]|uniref:ABC transporter ATP-binding protein n=1 Tax=Arthrobacter sp. ISL-30 TaxID=2819109 RepID=UPI001BEC268C|nr:ABC transporter ATP-binding protein [Arthrobacter sp. ISL-30]MBT2515082.1 ABC transporter ATP-binding protein [Arthrobacter sp. ISL-30]
MIVVKDLVRQFKSGDRTIKPVNRVSFGLERGTLASIVGKSGSGKSTLLSLLGALDKPTSGDVVVDGMSLAGLPDGKLTEYRRRDIGFVFQQFNLIPNLSAVDNVMLPIEFAGVRKVARRQRAGELLEQVQLSQDKHGRRVNRLSGGEQQRVAIARALANEPKLILADEPTGNLDEQTGEHIVELLKSLSRDHNTTILVVPHDRGLANKTDRRFRLQQGRLSEETVRGGVRETSLDSEGVPAQAGTAASVGGCAG